MNNTDLDAVDLISLLTEPGMEGTFEIEISEKLVLDDEVENEAVAIAAKPSIASKSIVKNKKNAKEKIANTSKKVANEATKYNDLKTKDKDEVQVQRPQNIFEITSEPLENDSLERISGEVEKCENCVLYKTRNKTVPGLGNPNAKLVFVGEAPGADEDRTGVPFVGVAGQHFDKILNAIGFSRDDIFICNILKCRPPGNRTPVLEEMVACTPFLRRQLGLIKPQLIACLGNTAIKYIIGPRTPGITRIHGEWFESIFKIPTMAMFHPSYLCRNPSRAKGSPNWQMWQDIKKLKEKYDSL